LFSYQITSKFSISNRFHFFCYFHQKKNSFIIKLAIKNKWNLCPFRNIQIFLFIQLIWFQLFSIFSSFISIEYSLKSNHKGNKKKTERKFNWKSIDFSLFFYFPHHHHHHETFSYQNELNRMSDIQIRDCLSV